MSGLALGTVQFGLDYGVSNTNGQVSLEGARKVLKLAKEHDISTLDTAPGYGNSEKVLGEIGANDFQIVTKTISLQLGVDNVLKSFHQSLADLNMTSVHGLLIHNIADAKDKKFDTLYKELDKLKQNKVINKIGFSTYTPAQVDFLLDNFDFDLIQVPFNVFDVRLLKGGQLKRLKNKGIEVHARSVFLQGILLNFQNLPGYFSTWECKFNAYKKVVKKSQLTLLEYALNFVMNVEGIDNIVVGVNDIKQLKEIIRASQKEIDNKLLPFEINDVNLLNPSFWKI